MLGSRVDDVKIVYQHSLIPSQLEELFSNHGSCCSKNCMANLINTCNNNIINSSSSSRSYSICTQLGNRRAASRNVSVDETPFQHFVFECRQPFADVLVGTESDRVAANKQLRTFLVASFEKNKVESSSPADGKNLEWIYYLYSLSKAPIQVCKTAYVAVTGLSGSAIDYAQKQIRNHVSSESLILAKDDIDAFDASFVGGIRILEDAFDYFGIDFLKFSTNNENNIVDINKLPDTPEALICAAYLIDWFNLSGEMEVKNLAYYCCCLYFRELLFCYFHSLMPTKFTWIRSGKKTYGKNIEQMYLLFRTWVNQ